MALNNDKNPIHGTKAIGLLEKKAFVEGMGSGPPILAAGVTSFVLAQAPPPGNLTLVLVSGCVCVWLLIAAVIKVLHGNAQDRAGEAQRSHDGLKAALHVLHGVVCHEAKVTNPANGFLRATFHRVVPPLNECEHIEQIVPYVGGDARLGSGLGRKFSVRSGITGSAIRTQDVFTMTRQNDDPEAYKAELIKEWHYTAEDVKNLTMDRHSGMSVPILDRSGQHVLGVVYLDSSQKNLFSTGTMQTLVLAACSGISSYTSERYTT